MAIIYTRLGPAGMPLACKGKTLSEGLAYLKTIGLNALEVQFTHGIRVNKEDSEKVVSMAKKNNIELSCHAPYWINCCSPIKEKQQISIRNLIESARAAKLLQIKTVVFHIGYYQNLKAAEAKENALLVLKEVLAKAKKENLDINFSPETAGKTSQFGSLQEVLDICKTLKLVPTIDFAHIHARNNGCLKTKEDYESIILSIKESLGANALNNLHCHFSGIDFGDKGEKSHLPISSNSPSFKPLAELIAEKKYNFIIICESPFLEKDALKMLNMLKSNS